MFNKNGQIELICMCDSNTHYYIIYIYIYMNNMNYII